MATVRSLDSTKSLPMSNDAVAPAKAELRSKVLAVGGIAGTYEELTGHKQELKVSMSVWVRPSQEALLSVANLSFRFAAG